MYLNIFPPFLLRRITFGDLPFASLDDEALPEWVSTLKEKNLLPREAKTFL